MDFQLALRALRHLRDNDEFAPSWARFRHVYEDRSKVGRGTELPKMLDDLPPRMAPGEAAGYRERIKVKQTDRKDAELRAEALELIGPSKWTPLRGDFDALTPMLTYDEVYTEDGTPRPEHEAAVREYARRWPAT